MFFMMGITEGRKDFDFNQLITCAKCGRYGSYNVFMTYMVLSLFFIPVLKWNRHYYVQTSCCGTVYELDADIGKRISKGESVEIQQSHLTEMGFDDYYSGIYKRCVRCGYETTEDFYYCPKCGEKL